ncbi:MAG TPA: hypothetical protein VLA79_21140 [Polyangia bacterium]|nr:hypothetical protein [Polyangia bacterium]
MTSFKTKSLGGIGWRFLRRGGSAVALVALLVGCSSGSGTTPDGGGGGSAGKTGGGGKGGSSQGGVAGSTAGTTGTGGSGGATGAGGVAGAAGAGAAGATGAGGTAGAGGKAGAGGTAGAGGKAGAGGTAGGTGTGGAAGGAAGAGTGGVDAGTHATDAGCQGVDLPGIGVPAGTVVTASSSLTSIYGPDASIIDAGFTYGADRVIDGDITTEWISGAYGAWITLTFPAPVMVSAIRVHADALPVTTEIYSVSTSTLAAPLGSATYPVTLSPGTVLPDIQITPGMYSNLTLTVSGGASWVGIDEIWLLAAPDCP